MTQEEKEAKAAAEAEEKAKADAEAKAKADAKEAARLAKLLETSPKKADETVPGGEYIVNGVKVNADGEPIETKKKKSE